REALSSVVRDIERGRRRVEERGDLESRVGEGLVVDNGLLNGGAGDAREGCEGAVGKMATIPKVDRGSITMIENEHTTVDVDEGKGVEVGSRGKRTARRLRLKAQRSLRAGRTCQRELAQTREP
ncbi:MAG: hypothetical protein OK454_04935, partial [Thaumarchaeota archaeon]|nr:hypothetical protein [Nitrososphaerota archaeon]